MVTALKKPLGFMVVQPGMEFELAKFQSETFN